MSGYDEQSDEQLQNPTKCTMKCIALNTSNDVNRSKKSSLQLSRSESSLLKTPRENLEERLEKLNIDYNRAGKICKRMEKFIVKLKEEIEAKNSTVKKLLSEKKDLQSKLNRSIKNCDTFEEKLEDMEEENRKLIAQIAHLTKEKIKEIENLEDKLKRYEIEEDKKKMLQKLNETKERLESKEQSKPLAEMRKRLRAGIPGFDRMTINEVISHILVTPTHEQLTGLEDLNVEHFIKSLEISSEDKKQEFREYIKQVYQKGYVRANVDLIMQQSLGECRGDAFYFRGNSITDKFQYSDPQSKHPPNSRNLKSILRMEFPEKPSSIL
ncbi:hypothetical protein L5515_015465 [Caenorhabditis briggsae]|uniref:Uncharacterized protein n=1 Tax=Caenorhabditis briggsae TaxID=6238 RepID=A0AAE9EG68_CAEBR|nr:hypothetical protein L5515_015465 [Caenorhabditis briggsae]